MSLWYIYVYVTPLPNGYVYCFNQFIQIFECWFISGLVKSVFERSLSGKKSQFLSKVVFDVTLGFTFHNLGTFWVLTVIMIFFIIVIILIIIIIIIIFIINIFVITIIILIIIIVLFIIIINIFIFIIILIINIIVI